MIKGIIIEIDGKEQKLSLEAAKKLKADLDELLNVVPYSIPYYIPKPWWQEPVTYTGTTDTIKVQQTTGGWIYNGGTA